MARTKKVQEQLVEKDITESISKNHPDRLEGNFTSEQQKRFDSYVAQISKEALTDKDNQPLVAAQLYNSAYAEMVGKGVNVNLETMALNSMALVISKRIKAKTYVPTKKGNVKAIVGFIVGDKGIDDKIKRIKDTAKKYIAEHSIAEARKEHTIETKKGPKVIPPYINDKNEILDTRAKLFGKTNPDYLKPLKDGVKDAQRNMFVVARISGTENFILTTLNTNERKLAYGWSRAKMFTPMTTYVNVKGEDKQDITFSSSSAQDTMTIFKALKDEEIDVNEIFMKIVESQITKMSDLEDEYELVKDSWDQKFFVRGIVTGVYAERKDSRGRISMKLMDENDNCVEIKVKIPEEVPINFGEGSTVIVLGKAERFVRKENDQWVEGDVGLSAYGIYPVPDLCTPADSSDEGQPVEEEEAVNGWEE
jgi:hypothetical protein